RKGDLRSRKESALPAKAFNPSASSIIGWGASQTSRRIDSCVSGCVPNPGPIATTVLPLRTSANRPDEKFDADTVPASVEAKGSVMYSGCAEAITGCTTSGDAMVVSPAPAHKEA